MPVCVLFFGRHVRFRTVATAERVRSKKRALILTYTRLPKQSWHDRGNNTTNNMETFCDSATAHNLSSLPHDIFLYIYITVTIPPCRRQRLQLLLRRRRQHLPRNEPGVLLTVVPVVRVVICYGRMPSVDHPQQRLHYSYPPHQPFPAISLVMMITSTKTNALNRRRDPWQRGLAANSFSTETITLPPPILHPSTSHRGRPLRPHHHSPRCRDRLAIHRPNNNNNARSIPIRPWALPSMLHYPRE